LRRALVIGLDCAPPRILYDELRDELPVLGRLIGDGERFILRSSHPPITIPAWMVMATGKTPGELGLYGFRHRVLGTYDKMYIADSTRVREEPLWNTLGKLGARSIVVGVPPSYPPRPIRGYLISDFITRDHTKNYTWPPWLKKEIEDLFGPYIFDVVFRTEDRDRVKKGLWEMTIQHFRVLHHLLTSK
jgi:predicted AlkP superfamily phosphohydrolase/phosphomutase